jgi:2',3'-cyclic-nucleotide 2'-phosphodiesterase (5'-nucleotidase family)
VPVLVLDAGNALFKSTQPGEPRAKERAELLLEQMDALGTAAMAVGARDLTLGTELLLQASKKGKMKVLSANLVDVQGKRLFEPSTVVTAGGVKFGVIGLSPEGPVAGQGGLVGQPLTAVTLAEAKRLRQKEKVDVVVVLAAAPYPQAQKLSSEVGNAVELIAQAHEGRGAGMLQRSDFATLIPPGERGRQLARVELSVEGTGPFADLTEGDRERVRLEMLDTRIREVRERLKGTKDESIRKALEEAVASMEVQRKALKTKVQAGTGGAGRTLHLSYLQLGPEVKDDPALKQRVERIEPPGSASH